MSETAKRYVYRKQNLFDLIVKIKLWPARSGILHGLKTVVLKGKIIEIETHCGEHFVVWNSRNSRSARYLRNRFCTAACEKCKVPSWKLEKYSATIFTNDTNSVRK
jgi:pyrrolysyl-tRNA synthetase-like protein